MSSTSALDQFAERYGPPAGEEGPVRLVREVLGAEPDRWQEQALRAYGRSERRVSLRSCHGPGKTALLSWLVWCNLLTRFPQKTVATAPSRGQLEDALVSEILAWGNKLPEALHDLFEFKKNRIELRAAPDESFFSARTAREENPEALQGVHSDGHVLLIADEASGVPEKIYEAAAGSMSGHWATTVLAGNPVRTTGFFFDTHHKLKDMWFTLHVHGVRDYPHGQYSPRVSDDFGEDIARRYGSDSNQYRVRVLGEFPLADLDTVIPWDLIESAQTREIEVPENLPEVWGLDVARFGDDDNALVRRNRLGVVGVESWRGKDLMQTAGRIKALWDETPAHRRPTQILVDVNGLGAGVVDRLRELKLPAVGVNVSESSAMADKYYRLRDELWFSTSDWLHGRDVKLPQNVGGSESEKLFDELATDLASVKYDITSTGKIKVEPKRDTKKRIQRSPNLADALVLTFAATQAALMGRSGHGRQSRDEPLRRKLALV